MVGGGREREEAESEKIVICSGLHGKYCVLVCLQKYRLFAY